MSVLSSSSAQDLTPYSGLPDSVNDRSVAAFSDLGAWHGFSLPPADRPDLIGGFVGPLLFDENFWLSDMLMQIRLNVDGRQMDLRMSGPCDLSAPPGMLVQSFAAEGLDVELLLFFDHSTRAVIRATVTNRRDKPVSLALGWTGSLMSEGSGFARSHSGVYTTTPKGFRVEVSAPDMEPAIYGSSYVLSLKDAAALGSEATYTAYVTVGLGPDIVSFPVDVDASLSANRERWGGYLRAIDTGMPKDHPRQILAEKALMTLISNWRSPRGALTNDGLFPSSAIWYFNGFWAWDSWKHAVAIARFDPDLAKQQVRAMYAYQNDAGMIADVVYTDTSENNWRDTKPPLSGWAIQEIYGRDGDIRFVEEMYPKLVRYHRWWYTDRDHDGDGLCEYGSTDGTLIAAKWESGMDNAVRFDDTKMLKNGDGAWSMDQESADLNAYLYNEKLSLASLAEALGLSEEAAMWKQEAALLGSQIREQMYDRERGWFSDIALDGSSFINAQGPEGWIPLWAGLATPEQAARVRETMLDPEKFYTYVPFPTVSRDDPEFSEGYWRGLVWIDQAWFAIEGLRRYGFDADARSAAERLISHLEGAAVPGVPLFENYHAPTGEGRNVRHFSWTAAHLLLLVLDVTSE